MTDGNRSHPIPFYAAGALPPAYFGIERDDDLRIEAALRNGELVHVRAPRKSGKSTLLKRLISRLSADPELCVVELELDGIRKIESAEHFISVLAEKLIAAFDTMVRAIACPEGDAQAIRVAAGSDPGWFARAAAALARTSHRRIIILVDEIEELLGEHRSTGEAWLLSLRNAHQNAGGAFTACLFGRLPVEFLIRASERTPFNTARTFVLPDFSENQVAELAAMLDADFKGMKLDGLIGYHVHKVTGGQPHLTQKLFIDIWEKSNGDSDFVARNYGTLIDNFLRTNHECLPGNSNTYLGIDQAFTHASVWPAAEALMVYRQMVHSPTTSMDELGAVIFDPWSEGQQMLDAIGLARILRRGDEGEDLLVVRNPVVAQIFDTDWLFRMELGLPQRPAREDDRPAYTEMLSRMEQLAVSDICQSEWALEHSVAVMPGSGRELVAGALFEFELSRRKPSERLTLQMFHGVGPFGRHLWGRQVRTLRRLSGRAGALPNIYRGALLADEKVAYIITQRPQFTLADPLFLDHIRRNRRFAIGQFEDLTFGLVCLAEEGVTHRNIWPGSIRFDHSAQADEPPEYKLSGFEFSVMLRSFVPADDIATRQVAADRLHRLRRAFLNQPKAAWQHAPPEFLQGLFGTAEEVIPALALSDIFSLGMLIAGWFVSIADPEGFGSVLVEGEGGEAAYHGNRHEQFIGEVRARISHAVAAHKIPATLRDILLSMLEVNPRERATPQQVLDAIELNRPNFMAWAIGERKPLLACYSYAHTARQLESFRLLSGVIGSEGSQRDVESFFEAELRGAKLFHAPNGIAPFIENADDKHRSAQWVLAGKNWLFYCQRYYRRSGGFGEGGGRAANIIRIAYIWPIGRLARGIPKELLDLAVYGDVMVVEQRSPELDAVRDDRYSSWEPLLAHVMEKGVSPSLEVADAAFDWLIEAEHEDLNIRMFDLIAKGPRNAAGQRLYQLDEDEYRKWIGANLLRSAVYRATNAMGYPEFFEEVMRTAFEERELQVRIKSVRNFSWSSARLEEVKPAGIVLSGRSLQERIRVELRSTALGRGPVQQQREAIDRLSRNLGLFEQLLDPHVVVKDEIANGAPIDEAIAGLTGAARDLVRKIVVTHPLVAVQGPPGTGKTAVIAAVVQSLLGIDSSHRILITSQSHAAVDNIALRIRDLSLPPDTLKIRVASDQQFDELGPIDERVRSWRPHNISRTLTKGLKEHCETRLRAEPDPAIRRAYQQLRQAAADGAVELGERIREGANIVFSTTAATRRVREDGFLTHGRFDLAIVDEASKAWPTEIIQPLLLADRQVLVGDHHQLPAFGAEGVERLLDECIATRREEFRILANNRDAIDAWLRLFKTFFDGKQNKFARGDDGSRLRGWRASKSVADQLDTQFRMRSGIANVVSNTFYRGTLKTGPTVDGRAGPEWLRTFSSMIGAPQSGLLWIDTADEVLFRNTRPAYNDDQAKLATLLLRRAMNLADGSPESNAHDRAVILSPYRRQNDRMMTLLANAAVADGGADRSGLVRTVDSFQGHEADLVVLSLVRGPMGPGSKADSAIRRYGFLTSPQRVNVMMSRARELLVILGDFEFFQEARRIEAKANPGSAIDLSFWERLCEQVRSNGRIINFHDLPSEFAVK